MSELFHEILFRPLLNTLVFIYSYCGKDIGIAIILLTVIVRLVLNPFSRKSLESQKKIQTLQPKIEELKRQYKDQKEVLGQEIMKLYRTEGVNPLSSCLPLLIQLPILIALYRVFTVGLSSFNPSDLYAFVQNPGIINSISLGLIDLSKRSIPLALLAAIAQFVQSKSMTAMQPVGGDERAAAMTKQMTIMMPAITLIFGFQLPGGLTLYWFVTTLLMGLQQYNIFKKNTSKQAAGKNP